MEEGLLTAEDLAALNLPDELTLKKFVRVANGLLSRGKKTRAEIEFDLGDLIQRPWMYMDRDNPYKNLVSIIMDWTSTKEKLERQKAEEIAALPEPKPFKIYGEAYIEEGALLQMTNAMRLPISLSGALMPDAHQGYGLPIGGVLATEPSKIIPYAVGVDIGCRMCLSIYDEGEDNWESFEDELKKQLGLNTFFGMGVTCKDKFDTALFDRPEWAELPITRKLRDKAFTQLGTSGSGNHFVEWGTLIVNAYDETLNIQPGKYIALLSHSGSRGFGGMVADYYSKLAMELTQLPKMLRHLAWLDITQQEGHEYWIAMNLAGDYASANHHEIHNKMTAAVAGKLGWTKLAQVENHHNFAWKETLPDGRASMVHRKGATPAGAGVLGIIPGSMTAAGYVVKGKGATEGLGSASHGAGRAMSRTKAKASLTAKDMRDMLKENGVEIIGGGLDEAPMAYKDIETVMGYQIDLVDILAKFQPRIVRMADAGELPED